MSNKFNIENFQNYCHNQVNDAEQNLDKIKHGVGSAKHAPDPIDLAEIYRAQHEVFILLFHIADKIKNISQLDTICKNLKNNYTFHIETEDREKYKLHWNSILDHVKENYLKL